MKPLTWFVLLVSVPLVFGQSNQKPGLQPKFYELSSDDSKRLDEQRALIAAAIKQRYGTRSLTRSKSDLPFLQKLLDERVFDKSQTYELQSLGVALGDVLTSE